jgi:hypothetical protein
MTERSPSVTRETWARRVEAWRASGERAEEFSKRDGGYMGSTLRYWASRLKQDSGSRPEREVRLARVTRRPSPVIAENRATAIVVEVVPARVRIAVAPGADRTTLAMVLDVLGVER